MRFGMNRISRATDSEGLTGIVQGQDASDLEERVARSLYKRKLEFVFQYEVRTAVSLPHEDRFVDFIVNDIGTWQALEIDGEIGHKTQSQKEKDEMRDVFVNEALKWEGIEPIIRIGWEKLETQELTDRAIREIL